MFEPQPEQRLETIIAKLSLSHSLVTDDDVLWLVAEVERLRPLAAAYSGLGGEVERLRRASERTERALAAARGRGRVVHR